MRDLRKNFKGVNYVPNLHGGAIVAGTNDGALKFFYDLPGDLKT